MKLSTIEAEKTTETPRSFGPQPQASLSGSDHSKSQRSPFKLIKINCKIKLIKLFLAKINN